MLFTFKKISRHLVGFSKRTIHFRNKKNEHIWRPVKDKLVLCPKPFTASPMNIAMGVLSRLAVPSKQVTRNMHGAFSNWTSQQWLHTTLN
jgi:hypothetical protein